MSFVNVTSDAPSCATATDDTVIKATTNKDTRLNRQPVLNSMYATSTSGTSRILVSYSDSGRPNTPNLYDQK